MASISSEDTIPRIRDEDEEEGSVVFQPQNPYPREQSEKKKKSCKSNCINGSLLSLKALLFIFYGGIGTIATWLNHSQLSSRFSERESLLIYGLSALFSLPTPIIFGLFSDKTASPKKVLGICLLLAGLLYPLIMAVPPAVPYKYRERLKWCKDTLESDQQEISKGGSLILGDAYKSSSSCVPNKLSCSSTESELITDYGGCSDGCYGRLVITACHFRCNESMEFSDIEYDEEGPIPQAQLLGEDDETDTTEDNVRGRLIGNIPHICTKDNPQFKYKNLCFAFDKDMHEINLDIKDISGYADHDGKCHYPLTGYTGSGEKKSLLSCSPLPSHCKVSCDLRWDTTGEDDQWTCQSDFVQWIISFSSFVAIHTLGTMLVISAAGLLNSAILSMSHEHSGFFGSQFFYAALGYATMPAATVLLFDLIHSNLDIPWKLEYLAAWSIWLVASAFLVFCLPYHSEWVPKPKTAGPMLRRWTSRGHTPLFFTMIIILGLFQILNDVLSFHQIKSVPGSLLLIAVGAAASVLPAIFFICRVEKVIDYCGHQNLFAIALVVLSLQFTGYAYLMDAAPEYSFLLRAMETFSIVMVWVTASYTTYAAAPRSLSATCQTIIATLYCCVGRGLGGLLGYISLTFIPKDLFLKIISVLAVFICIIYLTVHYCCVKPLPYSKPYDFDRPGSAAPSGKYTPLKLINGKKDKNLAKDEDLDEKEMKAIDDEL